MSWRYAFQRRLRSTASVIPTRKGRRTIRSSTTWVPSCSSCSRMNRELVADESAATAGQDRRTASEHARYYWLLLAEKHLTRRRFGAMLGRIALLPIPTG